MWNENEGHSIERELHEAADLGKSNSGKVEREETNLLEELEDLKE